MHCNVEFYYVEKIPRTGIDTRRSSDVWFWGTPLSEVNALYWVQCTSSFLNNAVNNAVKNEPIPILSEVNALYWVQCTSSFLNNAVKNEPISKIFGKQCLQKIYHQKDIHLCCLKWNPTVTMHNRRQMNAAKVTDQTQTPAAAIFYRNIFIILFYKLQTKTSHTFTSQWLVKWHFCWKKFTHNYAKFLQDSVYQKLLKLVHFWQTYSKNKRWAIFRQSVLQHVKYITQRHGMQLEMYVSIADDKFTKDERSWKPEGSQYSSQSPRSIISRCFYLFVNMAARDNHTGRQRNRHNKTKTDRETLWDRQTADKANRHVCRRYYSSLQETIIAIC